MDHDDRDDDPTPPDRLPTYGPAFDSAARRRRAAPTNGAPTVYVVEHPSRRMEAVDIVEAPPPPDEALGSLERVIHDVIERRTARKFRGLKAGIVTSIVAAIGTLVGGIKGSLDAREAAGVDKARLHQLEVEVDRLRSAVFPAPPPYWRREDAIALPPIQTAPQLRAPDPAQRGPLP